MSDPTSPYGPSGSYPPASSGPSGDRGGYSGPPQPYGAPTSPDPQYPQYPQHAGYPQYPYSPQQPAGSYGPPADPYGGHGYPANPYGGHPANSYGAYPAGYPLAPRGPARPGLVLTASILGYVLGGLLVIAGALLLFGGSIVSDVEDSLDSGTDYGTELALDGVLNLLVAGLVIGGAVAFTSGRSLGRTLLTVGNGLTVAAAVYWLIRFTGSNDVTDAGDGVIVWAVIFGVLAILGLAFSFTGATNRWLQQTAS